MKLLVKNLFKKYDYQLNLDNKLNIIVGENGRGKSTILNLLNHIIQFDFIELVKFDFEYIEIKFLEEIDITNFGTKLYKMENSNDKVIKNACIKIMHSDLTPLKYIYDIKFKVLFLEYLEKYDFISDIDGGKNNFSHFYDGFIEYCELNKSGILIDVNPYNFEKYLESDFMMFFNKSVAEIKEDCTSNQNEYYLYSLFANVNVAYGSKVYFFNWYVFYITKYILAYKKNELDELKKTHKHNFVNNSICLTLAIQNLGLVSSEEKPEIECIYKRNAKYYYTKAKLFNDIDNIKYDFLNILYENEYFPSLGMMGLFYAPSFTNSKSKRIPIEYINYVNFKDLKVYKNVSLFSLDSFNKYLNDISLHFLNSKKKIEKFSENDMYFNNVKNLRYLFSRYSNFNSEHYYDDRIINSVSRSKIDRQFKEYILENIILNETIEKSLKEICENDKLSLFENSKNVGYSLEEVSRMHFKHYDFIDAISKIDSTLYQDTANAKKFYNLVSKYFNNKEFKLFYDENFELDVYIYDKETKKEVFMDMLSAGEYKMLRLIKYMAFGTTNIALLDEPELSLSLFWQNMLLNDIKENLQSHLVIIATQSPYLIDEKNISNIKEIKIEEYSNEK